MLNNIMTITEASKIWNKDVRTLRAVFAKGINFKENIDTNKSEGTWLVTKESMERVYGKINPKNKQKIREAKMNDKYKLIICNMGYTDSKLCELDGLEGSLRDINRALRNYTNYFKKKIIDDSKVKYICNGNLAPFQFNYENTVTILEINNEPDRCIYVRYLE